MDRVPDAGDDLLARPMRLDDLSGADMEITFRRRFLQRPGRLLDGAAEAVAHAQQARRDRRLQRLRRAKVGQPGGDGARRETVLDQGHDQGVEHHRLLARRKPALQLEECEVAERHLADEVRREVAAADEDLVGRAAAEAGRELLAAHFRTVSFVL